MSDLNLSYNLFNFSIFLSVIYFLFTIIGIYEIGKILTFKRFNKSYYNYVFGLFFILFLSSFASLNVSYINYFILFCLIFGVFKFIISFYRSNSYKGLSKEVYIFLLFFILFFYDAFYNFNPLDDDLRGYFSIIKQYSDGNFVNNPFDFRKLQFFPSYYFLVSIFFENGNFYNFKFVDKFFGYLLIYLIIDDKIKINKKNLLTKTFYILIFLILIVNEPLTSTPNILLTAIILFALCEIENFYTTKKETHLFLFYLSLFFLIILKLTVLPFVLIIGFLVFLISFYNKQLFSFKLLIYLTISLLIIFGPWFFWSYINFNTLWFPLLGNGNFFLGHENLKNIIEFDNSFLNKINYLINTYNFYFIIEFYDKQILNIVFLIILLTLFKNKINNLIIFSFLFAIIIFFTSSYSFLLHVDRQIMPIFSGILIFFLLQYNFGDKLKILSKFNFLLIFLLLFNIKLIGSFFLNVLEKSIFLTKLNKDTIYKTIYPKHEMEELIKIENQIDSKKILTIISKPYLLNFQKNNYLTKCYYNFIVSPQPGYPIFSEFKEKEKYFKGYDIEYFLLEKSYFQNQYFDNYNDYIQKNKKDPLLENFYEFFYKIHISSYVDFLKYVNYLMINNIIYETEKYVLIKL